MTCDYPGKTKCEKAQSCVGALKRTAPEPEQLIGHEQHSVEQQLKWSALGVVMISCQLLRIRRIRDWSKECRDGRKAKFTPLDTVRYDLEQKIGFEEFILALSSCWVLSYQISYESAAKETPFPDIAVLGKYQNKHNNKNYLFKSKILFTPRVYKKKADEFGNLWMRNCRTVYFLSWWGRTTPFCDIGFIMHQVLYR